MRKDGTALQSRDECVREEGECKKEKMMALIPREGTLEHWID